MSKKKNTVVVKLALVGVLLAIMAAWFFVAIQKSVNSELMNLLIPLIVIIPITLAIVHAMHKSKKNNHVLEDEMSDRVKAKAGYYAFISSIYYLLVLGFVGNDHFVRPSQATGFGIIGMVIIFLIYWAAFNRRGSV